MQFIIMIPVFGQSLISLDALIIFIWLLHFIQKYKTILWYQNEKQDAGRKVQKLIILEKKHKKQNTIYDVSMRNLGSFKHLLNKKYCICISLCPTPPWRGSPSYPSCRSSSMPGEKINENLSMHRWLLKGICLISTQFY